MRTSVIRADAYYRLSKEEATRGESSSISNQREIVRAYCKERGIELIGEFIDDGYSGSNFERPGFQSMLAHIASGVVNMVITKDLSRLGRDMTESSNYAERFFPEHGIHYITITDGFDSSRSSLLAPFQFAMNDVYLRDTSRKVKQVLEHKRKKGQYCACPPFGYMKDPRCKNRLIPDPETAPIVKRIFSLAVSGESSRSIARILNADMVIPPLKYRVLYRDNFSDEGAKRVSDEWNYTTVKRILRNQVYLGHTVLGKSKKVSIKSTKKVALPKEEWAITRDTHEPLVSQEDFDIAERYLGEKTKAWHDIPKVRHSIFGGLVFCESCGAAMCSGGSVYNGERNKYWYLVCNNIPKRDSKHCKDGARIRYDDLMEIVRLDLNSLINLSDEEIHDITELAVQRATGARSCGEANPLEQIEKRLSEIEKIISKLYRDNIAGKIRDDMLDSMVSDLNEEAKKLDIRANELRNEQTTEQGVRDSFEAFFEMAKQYTQIDVLTRDILLAFIERIEIGKKVLPEGYKVAGRHVPYKQNIRIVYRFVGDMLSAGDMDAAG